MAFFFMILLIAPPIGIILWNSLLHGMRYKVVYTLPPFKIMKGKLIRALLFIYLTALLGTLIAAQYDQATSEGYRGAGRIVDVIILLLLALGIGLFLQRRRPK
jgi:hypothetical protein